jgi:hypothetical protein
MSNKDDLTHKEYVSENGAGVFVEDPALERRFVGHPPICKMQGLMMDQDSTKGRYALNSAVVCHGKF